LGIFLLFASNQAVIPIPVANPVILSGSTPLKTLLKEKETFTVSLANHGRFSRGEGEPRSPAMLLHGK
jgi:hypothetical protein